MKQLLKNAYPSTIVVANSSGRIFFSLHEFVDGDRAHITQGLAPASNLEVNGSTNSGHFAIPMQTFDAGGSLLGPQMGLNSPPQTLGGSVSSKGKGTMRSHEFTCA
ncbi:hypothetical protein B0J17DRAFT_629991 [Rhizoctonia solani]|nr:hypothetical protein B0J17DRAFT_629991 [Rhizoctonia solani]